MSMFAGAALGGIGSAISGLFGGNNASANELMFRDLAAYGLSLDGLPLYNTKAQAKYGLPQGQQTNQQQARGALTDYQNQVGGLLGNYAQQGQGNINQYLGGLGGLINNMNQRGAGFSGQMLGDYDRGTNRLLDSAGAVTGIAQRLGSNINSDFDALARRGSGDLYAGMNNRGLANSTIASAGASQFAGEMERARQGSLAGAANQEMQAQQYITNLAASREAARPAIQQTAFGLQSAADPYSFQALQQGYGVQDQFLNRMLGSQIGVQDRTLGLLGQPDMMYSDPYKWASLYAGAPQQSGGNNWASSFGSGLAGIGSYILGNSFGGGGGSAGGGGSFGGFNQSLPSYSGLGV